MFAVHVATVATKLVSATRNVASVAARRRLWKT
jgi:hypothetical protein